MLNHIKIALLSSTLWGVSIGYADVKVEIFTQEKALISYDIYGGGVLTPDTNLSINGKAQLYFNDFGEMMIEEEEGVVLTTGSIRYKQAVQRFEQHTKKNIITVDFLNKQLLERKVKITEQNKRDESACLVKSGKDTVAGLECDIWKGGGITKCIYKGILLKLESNLSNISYVKVATQINFDINKSENTMILPDYPIHKFALFKDNLKTKNIYKTENLCTILKTSAEKLNDAKNIEDKENFINYISRNIYKKQKEFLPKLLVSMKKTRECLQVGEDPFTANQCIEEFSRMKSQSGTQEDDYIILWDKKRKEKLLDKIEDEIIHLESRIACVNRAKNIIDLSKCMK